MKKNIKKIILLLVMLFTCSCAKDETIMTINSDKSVNLEVNVGYSIESGKEIDIVKLKDNVSPLGYNVDSYHDDKFVGYRITKKFDNINDISTNEEININFADLINGKLDDSKLFKIKKGFFKNIYTANYSYDFNDLYDYKVKIYVYGEETNEQTNDMLDYLNQLINKNTYPVEIHKYNVLSNMENFNYMNELLNKNEKSFQGIPVIVIGNTIYSGNGDDVKEAITEDIKQIFENDIYYEDIISNDFDRNYELIYKVNLPGKYITTNANELVNDGKTLIWNQGYFNPQKIEFTFSIFNKSSIVIIVTLIIFIIAILIAGYIFYIKYQNDKNRFIKRNTTINNILPKTEDDNQITSINDLMQK